MINICIVGFGSIGPVHAEALKNVKNVKIYAICDINKERADIGAEKNSCKAFYDFEDVLKDGEIDAIHICTPHYLHYEMIEKSILACKIVVVEKPVTMTKAEFAMLMEKYPYAPVYPVFQNRTNHAIVTLKSLISDDVSNGKLLGIKGIQLWRRDADYYNQDEWRGTEKYEGGGVLINQAIHTLDLMGYLGGGFKSVRADSNNFSLDGIIEVEDTVNARFEMQNGSIAIFYATNAFSIDTPVQIDMYFEKKTYSYTNGKLFCNNEIIAENDNNHIGKTCYGTGHIRLLNSVYNGDGGCIMLKDIENSMNGVFALYESAKNNGKEILI